MSQIQDRPKTGLPLVVGHDGRLDPDGASDGLAHQLILPLAEPGLVSFQPVEEMGLADHGRLDDLRQPGPVFPVRQGLQRRGVRHYHAGLVEGADQVLTGG